MFNLTAIMTVLAVLIILIQLTEQLLGSGTGDQKKAAVIEAVKQLLAQFKIVLPAFIVDNLGAIIDVIVALFNKFGPFVKSAPK